MIFFAELQMQGDKHVHVNSGLLNVLRLAFANEEIHVTCDNLHKRNLVNNVTNLSNISFTEYLYTGDKELNKSKMLGKLYREISLAFRLFKQAKEQNAKLVIFCSVFPFTAPFVKLFAIFFRRQVIMCMHGDVGVLRIERNKLTTILFKTAVKLFFLIKSRYTTVLFYGDSIYQKLFNSYPKFQTDNVISIDHPYNYDAQIVHRRNEIIVVANIGTGLMQKNSHLFYKLAALCKTPIIAQKIKFVQIGNVAPNVLKYANDYVNIVNDNKFIPFDSFQDNLIASDYFVYFFTEGSLYDFCPSGTFFDAIKYQKPIIALKNPFFEHYFARLGNIGYLCNDILEMQTVIEQILSTENETVYNIQVENLKNAALVLSQKNISDQFKAQVKKYVDGN